MLVAMELRDEKAWPKLEELRLWGFKLTTDVMQVLRQTHTAVRMLRLIGYTVELPGDDATHFLAECFRAFPSVEVLHLSDIFGQTTQAVVVAAWARVIKAGILQQLREVQLDGSRLDIRTIYPLVEAVRGRVTCPKMQLVHVTNWMSGRAAC